MADPIDAFAGLLGGGKPAPRPSRPVGPQEGTVIEVTGDTALVELSSSFAGQRFGPLPFSRTDTPPQVGDRCLVIFVGPGVKNGWLLSWTPAD